MSYFYFEQMFRTALGGINGTSVMSTVVQIASAILLATLLFNVYEAFARGGDIRTLAVGGVKYLIIGLIFLNYGAIFLGVNTMFNQVAEFISSVGPGGMDVFDTWRRDIATQFQSLQTAQSFFNLAVGSLTAILSLVLLFIGFIAYAITYAIFCVLYSLYGSVLYVVGPLVLALYPAMSTTPLARTYLTNLIVFHAWGLIYAIMGCLMWAINMGSVTKVMSAQDAGGFFAGASQTLLLALTSILFALCIALIPFLARRIVQGDVGSTMFAIVGVAATAATMGASAVMGAMGGFGKASSSGGEAGAASPPSTPPSGPPPPRTSSPEIQSTAPAIAEPPRPPADGPTAPPPTPGSPESGSAAAIATPAPAGQVQQVASLEETRRMPSPYSGSRSHGHAGHRGQFSYMHAMGWAFGTVLGQGYKVARTTLSSGKRGPGEEN